MKDFFPIQSESTESTDKCRSIETALKQIFNETEQLHADRSEAAEPPSHKDAPDAEPLTPYRVLEKRLAAIDNSQRQICPGLLLLSHLVEGNLFLRKGEYEDAHFQQSRESYTHAQSSLQKCFEACEKDDSPSESLIPLLLHLCFGKYFRNLGHCDRRSSFHLAMAEFNTVQSLLSQRNPQAANPQIQKQELYILLDTQINIARAHKNLYELEQAESSLLSFITALSRHSHDTLPEELAREIPGLPMDKDAPKFPDPYRFLEQYQELYRQYMLQAFVQLCIVYRKKRDYEKAEQICAIILRHDPLNIDARNNQGVCLRKKEQYIQAETLFAPLMKNGVRFAKLNYCKCLLKELEASYWKSPLKKINPEKETKKADEIGTLLESCGKDRDMNMLYGRYQHLQGEYEAAISTFESIYEQYPYIEQGTVGLKASYNIAKCLLAQEKFQQAYSRLQEILKVCPNDLLAQIDLGWCLMKLNQYAKAKRIYEKICAPSHVTSKFHKLNKFEQMKVYNNLGECCLYTGETKKAKEQFDKILKNEPYNKEALGFLAQYHMQRGREAEKCGDFLSAATQYRETILSLQQAAQQDRAYAFGQNQTGQENREEQLADEKSDFTFHIRSNLIIAHAAYWQLSRKADLSSCAELQKQVGQSYDYLQNRLLYYRNLTYSQKAYIALAKFLNPACYAPGDPKRQPLYIAFSGIMLRRQEKGYDAFSRFMKLQDFLCLKADERGWILAVLFLIYGHVMQIKEACRYPHSSTQADISIPAHYTAIRTLKILLAKDAADSSHPDMGILKTPRLRLWNSVYMNDPHEGSCFLRMLEAHAGQGQTEILPKYFPHLNNTERNLSPVNSNIYITSFTEKKDDLFMWVAYADGAKGCSITFADDYFDIHSRSREPLEFHSTANDNYPLYEVHYINMQTLEQPLPGSGIASSPCLAPPEKKLSPSSSTEKELQDNLSAIWESLQVLEGQMIHLSALSSANVIRSFVSDALNEVRFLFKSSEYEQEAELRLICFASEAKLDENFDIPRLYIEVDKDIQIKDIMLGSKITPDETDKLVAWLHSLPNVEHISKSEKHFR